MAYKAVNTTLTLPLWLKSEAKEHCLNLPEVLEVLQYAFKERLGIHERR
ncbi:hypothetical protein ACOJUR_08255 [Alicyclobacillus tolerans]